MHAAEEKIINYLSQWRHNCLLHPHTSIAAHLINPLTILMAIPMAVLTSHSGPLATMLHSMYQPTYLPSYIPTYLPTYIPT